MCFAAEDDDISKKETEPTANDNNSHATPPKSPSPIETSPTITPTKPATAATVVPELNGGTTPDRKPSPEPKTPEPASENINNIKSNNKNVEELYDIPVGK